MGKLDGNPRNQILVASLIGAFGGMAPKIIEMIPNLFRNVYPSPAHLLALVLLAFIGGVIVFVYKEINLQKALILGAGAPALIATLTAQAVAPKSDAMMLPIHFSIVASAYAQPIAGDTTVTLTITKNESPYKLNTFWLRADGSTIKEYAVNGETIVCRVPKSSKILRLSLSENVKGIALQIPDLLKAGVGKVRVVSNRQSKDFWQTFGNARVADYSIEMSD